MIAHVISRGIWMSQLVESQAGHLVQLLPVLGDNGIDITGSQTIRTENLDERALTEGLERTAVELTSARWLLAENLLTRPGLVVIALTLLTVAVSDVVSVLLLKLVAIHLEVLLPEG